ncbi:MAG: energy transducer TonB [Deltaproteobacteria bacterium]|jgi:protein TonB|nr:energy transducer TonB [Deltaproteobacteria bacterium]
MNGSSSSLQPTRLTPLQISLLLHAAVAIPFLVTIFAFPRIRTTTERVPIRIVETNPPPAANEPPKAVRLNDSRPLPKPINAPVPVFGLSNQTLKDSSSTVEIKAGNTIAKEIDNLKALNDDALPIPTDEFLVTQMPRIKKEIRAQYPEAARNARIEGPIVLDLLINAEGAVVDVKVVSGLGYGLDEAAVNAIKLFEFEPARVQDQKVAVKIRYTYRFELRS